MASILGRSLVAFALMLFWVLKPAETAWAGTTTNDFSQNAISAVIDPCHRFGNPEIDSVDPLQGALGPVFSEIHKSHSCKYDLDNAVDLENPYQACKDYKEAALDYYDSCTDHDLVKTTHSFRAQLARREQIKTLLMQEMTYLKRLSPNTPGFDRHWIDFKERWTAVLDKNPDIKNIDQDAKLGPDRCAVHQMLSLPCGGLQDPGILKEMKDEAIRGHEVSSQMSGLPDTISMDLVKAALLVDSVAPHGTPEVVKRWYQDTFANQPEKTQNRNSIVNYVYAYFPEFEKDPKLIPDLLHWLDSRYDLKKLRATFKGYDSGKTGISKRNLDINTFLKEKQKQDPIKDDDLHRYIKRFGDAQNEIRNDFKKQIERGKTDPQWLFDQDYLMQGAMRLSASIEDDRDVAFYQTQICHNVRNEHDAHAHQARNMTYASVGIAVAGLGAVFLSGPIAMIALASSAGMSGLVSISQIQEAYAKFEKSESIFYTGGKSYSAVESDNQAKNFALAQGALTAISGPTMMSLKQLGIARQAAIAAGDLKKAESLAQTEKNLLRLSNTVDASFSGLSLASGDIQGAIFGASMMGSNQLMAKFPALKERAAKMLKNRARYGQATQK